MTFKEYRKYRKKYGDEISRWPLKLQAEGYDHQYGIEIKFYTSIMVICVMGLVILTILQIIEAHS